MRDYLGGVKARDVDLALALLERVGAVSRAERGERKAARWSLAPLNAEDGARAGAKIREMTGGGSRLDVVL